MWNVYLCYTDLNLLLTFSYHSLNQDFAWRTTGFKIFKSLNGNHAKLDIILKILVFTQSNRNFYPLIYIFISYWIMSDKYKDNLAILVSLSKINILLQLLQLQLDKRYNAIWFAINNLITTLATEYYFLIKVMDDL